MADCFALAVKRHRATALNLLFTKKFYSFAMLDNLTQRLAKVVKTMRGEARLTESNTADMLREVRMALLEADVALPAVRELIARVKEKAMGEEVISSLTPGQALVGIVQKELAVLMGADLGEEACNSASPASHRRLF
jgi:signal recognition particle GTPase